MTIEERAPNDVMLATLEVAVPLWQMRVRTWSEDQRIERGRIVGYIVAEHGDNIMFRGPKKGDTARAFNAMAEGLAIASFSPGGVTFCGRHWEA